MEDPRAVAARFLMRASFGPTRQSIEDFLNEHGGSPRAWLEAQMEVPATGHRAFLRRHSNPRMPDGAHTDTGVIRSACSGSSRWNRFAFSDDDVLQTIDVVDAGAGQLALSVLGSVRTVVNASVFEQMIYNIPEESRSYSSVHGDHAIGTGNARSMLDSADVWAAARRQPENVHAAGEWMELDLGSEMQVAGIVTQGRRGIPWSAGNLTVQYSTDGVVYTNVSGEIAHGMTPATDGDASKVTNIFEAGPVAASRIRIVIHDWVGWPALRAAVLVNVTALPSPMTHPICSVQEFVGGRITMGVNCSIYLGNPTVAFASGFEPEPRRMVATVSADTELTELQYRANIRHAGAVLLPETGVAWACDAGTPSTGALFASVEDTGGFLVHDRRLALVENSLESPAGPGGFAADEGQCATVPRTYVFMHACRPPTGHTNSLGARMRFFGDRRGRGTESGPAAP